MIFFIILYGTYGITYSKGPGGSFPCPNCKGNHGYRHRRVRRFFHIFFIPLIPLNLAGEYVECGNCKSTYKMTVLGNQAQLPAAKAVAVGNVGIAPVLSESQRAIRRLLALICLADGHVHENELQVIAQILSRGENRQFTRDEIVAEVEAARREPADIEAYCRSVMGFLNEQGRASILDACNQIARADGNIDASEQRMLERMGVALGLRPAQVASHSGPLPQQQPRAPFCGNCGQAGRWIAESNAWGCDRCRAVIPA
ncbi:MAG TPA: TerB family tellurite resistance protein [Kofleriaceae bacterium]